MDEPIRRNGKQNAERALSSEVDELVGASQSAEPKGADALETSRPLADDDFSAERAKKKRGVSTGAVVFRALFILLLLALAGAVAIMEPWVAPEAELVTDPAVEKLAPRAIAAGETYKLEVPLDSNELISEIAISDETLLSLADGSVTGVGAYFEPVTVSITTMEKEVPVSEPKHKLVIGVRDYSQALDSARSWLRDLVGIEKKKPPRTETAVLHRYEQLITVEGLDPVTEESAHSLETYLGAAAGVELALGEGQAAEISSLNGETAEVSRTEGAGKAVLSAAGKAVGKTKAVVDYGFYKEIDAETYARWLKWKGAADGSGGAQRIFVPTRRLLLPVTVVDLDEPVVQTELDAKEEKTASDYDNGHIAALAGDTLALVNEARAAEGLAALTWSGDLEDIADARSKALAESFATSAPDGSAAELIAGGFETARAAVDAWLGVPETRAALMSASATGFACSLWRASGSAYGSYWCAELV